MNTADTQSETPPIRRYPEARRPRQISARPKSSARSPWPAISRANQRLAGLVMAASAASRSAN